MILKILKSSKSRLAIALMIVLSSCGTHPIFYKSTPECFQRQALTVGQSIHCVTSSGQCVRDTTSLISERRYQTAVLHVCDSTWYEFEHFWVPAMTRATLSKAEVDSGYSVPRPMSEVLPQILDSGVYFIRQGSRLRDRTIKYDTLFSDWDAGKLKE